jgi:hypothetical protein
VSAPSPAALRGRRLGDIVVALGLALPEQVVAAAEEARLLKALLGQILLKRKLVTPEQLRDVLSLQSGLPLVDFPVANVPLAAKHRQLLPTMVRFELVPFDETDQEISVAVKRPPSPLRTPDIEKAFGKKVHYFLAPDEQIAATLVWLGGGPSQKQGDVRYKMVMAVWLQVCDRREAPVSANHGGWILGISTRAMTVEAPDALIVDIRKQHAGEPLLLVRFSTAPLEVHGSCVVRTVRKKDCTQLWENPWVLDLEFKTLGAEEREHFMLLHKRSEVAQQLLELEFGMERPEPGF